MRMGNVHKLKYQRRCRLCKKLFTTIIEQQKYCESCVILIDNEER